MSNEHLVKSAHIWAVIVMLFGAIVFAGNAGSNTRDLAQQNQNSNANQNQNRNANQNANVVTNKNSNNSNATAGEVATSGMSSRDQKFITEKAMSGMMEVELGRWAAQKGTSRAGEGIWATSGCRSFKGQYRTHPVGIDQGYNVGD